MFRVLLSDQAFRLTVITGENRLQEARYAEAALQRDERQLVDLAAGSRSSR